MQSFSDTIAAISTPIGIGGVSVIRISGNKTQEIVSQLCSEKKFQANHIVFTRFYNSLGDILDEGLISFFKSPHSYTGEDVAEVNCHGGYITVKQILDCIISYGARLADKGEFTQRAFINGKIDLLQAESIIDIIESKTDKASTFAVQQLEGTLSKKITQIRSQLLEIISHLEVHLDYPEEEDLQLHTSYITQLSILSSEIENLLSTYQTGRIFREGILTVIVGKPNVGKSSLLNMLLEENRAIVSDEPGTTRDTIEEWIQIEGLPFRLVDTAGLREAQNNIEKIGIEKTREFIGKADIQIVMLDADTGIELEDQSILKDIRESTLIVINKSDVAGNKMNKINEYLKTLSINQPSVVISVKENTGTQELIKKMLHLAETYISFGTIGEDTALINNDRQKEKLLHAKEDIKKAIKAIEGNLPEDFWLIDLKQALTELGEITGESVSDEILNNIFSRFCVGK
ncbi:MAG: tRNA uridine-5-carboxymethylaminomethyl(34) synthesis GTPase MnmE [Candidatus Margulisbacteria bacterium GWF2_35_9]|nr:MAG: tRNA uridine-5-carboxymethylaminomethyl(34) synthesis GTPase MnmE [Candidatus Margulisbacteria bacterium GWF2_35_9]